MRFASFRHAGDECAHFGALLEDGEVLDFCAEGSGINSPEAYLDWFDMDGAAHSAARALLGEITSREGAVEEFRGRGVVVPVGDVCLVAPVPRPGKVICIGLNYRDHAAESGMDIPEQPVTFSKFPTSVVGPGDDVVLPPGSDRSDYEAELAVVIGRRSKSVRRDDAYSHVLGYTNFNDVSERRYQFADGQWQRGKSCDTFAPMGEYIASPSLIPDPHILKIQLHLNGETVQDSNTDQLIFGVPELIAFLTESITLEPGDVIATGTPPGVGFARKPPVYLAEGDVMEVEIEGLGILRNPVSGA